MRTVEASKARANFAALLDEVAEGAEIVITRKGVQIARLVPINTPRGRPVSELIQRMREISQSQKLDGLRIRS